MNETFAKIKNSKTVGMIQKILSSKYFPFVTAAVTLLSYYLGWDVVLFYYIAIAGILMLLFLDDITPIISLFLFMSVSISLINTPSPTMGNSDYYHDCGIQTYYDGYKKEIHGFSSLLRIMRFCGGTVYQRTFQREL